MVDIKKDLLGGLPQQITEANDNLKGFLGTFQQFMSALQQIQGQMGSTISRMAGTGATPTLFGPQGQPVIGAHAGGGDPASILAMQTQSGQITSAINNLAHSNAQNNLALTRTLESLNSAINQLSGAIGNLGGTGGASPGGVQSLGLPIPGAPTTGGGAPKVPALVGGLQGFSRVASVLAAGVAGVAGGYEIYNQAALSQDKILQSAELKRLQAQASLSEFAAKVNLESHDMTNAENIIRYRGNMFLPRSEQGKYFGSSASIARSYELAGESVKIQIENEKRQRDLQMMSSLGKGIGGAIKGAAEGAIGGAAIGSLFGGIGAAPGAVIGGIGGLLTAGISSAGDITRTYLESPYTALTGGLSTGIPGAFGRSRRGEQYDRLAKVAEEAARLGIPVNMNDLARQYQDAEMQARAPYAKTIVEQRLDLVKARQEGALLVGEYAVSERDYFKFSNNERSQMVEQIRKENEKAATDAAAQKSKVSMAKVTAEIQADKSPFMFTKLQGVKKSMDLYDKLDETDLPAAEPPGFEKFQNYNLDRLMRAVRTVETGTEAGDYNSVNSIGMVGAYQISPRVWDGVAKKRMGMSVMQMRGNKEVQDKFYKEVLAPQFKQQAIDLQKRNDLAKMLPLELVAGLEQLGPGNVESFFKTGNPDIYGNNAVAYLRGLSRSSGLKIPTEFFDKLNKLGGAGTTDFGTSPVAGAPAFVPQAMGLASSLEMSTGDFNRHRNQLTNLLGSTYIGEEGRPYQGLVAGEGQTARMIRLGRSGLGTFDQMLGNLGMINQVSGGQDNTSRLESVLTQAVAAGFDKSRTAQQFVQTTGQVAESLRVTNMANISAVLGTATGLSSAYGVADERGLKQAAAGLQSYAQFTGQQGGLSGTLTAIGALRAGFKPNQGFNIVSTLNATQMSDFIDTLNSGGPITDRKLLDLMSVSGVSDRKKLADMLKSVREVTTAPFSTKLEQFYAGRTVGGIKFTTMPDFMRQLATTGRKTQNQALQEMSTRIGELFANDIVGEQGGRAYLAEEAKMSGISGAADLNKKIDRSNAVYRDAATQNRFNFIEQLTRKEILADSGATRPKEIRDMYFDAIKNGVGLTRTVNVGGKEIPVNEETYNKGTLNGKSLPSGFKSAAEDMFNNMTGFELAREAQERGESEAGTQHVHIDNYYDVGNAIAIAMSIQKIAMGNMGPP